MFLSMTPFFEAVAGAAMVATPVRPTAVASTTIALAVSRLAKVSWLVVVSIATDRPAICSPLMPSAMSFRVDVAVTATLIGAAAPTLTVTLPAAATKVPVVEAVVTAPTTPVLSYSLMLLMLTLIVLIDTTPPARENDDTTDFVAL